MGTSPVTVNISQSSAGAIKNKVAQIAAFSKGLDSEQALNMVAEALNNVQNQLNALQRSINELATAVNNNASLVINTGSSTDNFVTINGVPVTY